MGASTWGQWISLATTGAVYRLNVLPAVRRELSGWREAAAAVPDPVLRHAAVEAVGTKAANSEATGVLATLAPRQTRRSAIRGSTALQVAIDYLDSLGEEPSPDPLRDGLALHGALGAALSLENRPKRWYAHHPQEEDGGYLERLMTTCQKAVLALPSAGAILPLARHAAERCGEGQSYTHAASQSPSALEAWARGLDAPGEFEWWEVAAGASSSVAAHALIALAGATDVSSEEGERLDRAYFPGVGALTVLLDDLVDREGDRLAGQHNYLDYYASPRTAAERIEAIVRAIQGSLRQLSQAPRHLAILTGILAFYLGSLPATNPIKKDLLASSDPTLRALIRVPGIAS